VIIDNNISNEDKASAQVQAARKTHIKNTKPSWELLDAARRTALDEVGRYRNLKTKADGCQ